MDELVKVAVWHENDAVLSTLVSAVESIGYEVGCSGRDGDRLIQEVTHRDDVGLIICGLQLGGREAVDCLLDIASHRPIPAIVVTAEQSLAAVEKALEDHVMAYLIEPIRESEIRPTIYLVLRRFEQFQELHEEVEDLKERLVARKRIERAKGVVMRRSDVDEEGAYERLRRMAMDQRIKLTEAAERILEVEELLK